MKNLNLTDGLFDFIEKSPTAYQAVAQISAALVEAGYTELAEGAAWSLADGGKYFTVRNGTSIVAFRYNAAARGFMIVSSHTDSPTFKVKASGSVAAGAYTRLPTERYGGMAMHTWLNRPLSIAGRAVVRTPEGLRTRLVNVERDLLTIPGVAIHLNRTVNDGLALNAAKDMVGLLSVGAKKSIESILSAELGVSEDSIVSHDLFLYNRERGRYVGCDGELILCPRLDNLECVYASLTAFLKATDANTIPVLAAFDNEEVGSDTKQGASSTLLRDVLTRIAGGDERYFSLVSNGMMVSADNAHALHPNHPELYDAENAPEINGGVVIKYNSNQRYATDAVSGAVFSEICKRAGVKTQTFHTRADMAGGSTLGSIATTKVPISTVDVGLGQLAMHSATETAGTDDLESLVLALHAFFGTELMKNGDEITIK